MVTVFNLDNVAGLEADTVLSYNLAHWIGTQFRRLCGLIRRSRRVCLGSCGSRLNPTNMYSGKPAFMSHELWPALLDPRGGGFLQAPIHSEKARFIGWRTRRPFLEECRRKSRHFFEPPVVCGLTSCTWLPQKKAMCHTRTYVRRSTNIRRWKTPNPNPLMSG